RTPPHSGALAPAGFITMRALDYSAFIRGRAANRRNYCLIWPQVDGQLTSVMSHMAQNSVSDHLVAWTLIADVAAHNKFPLLRQMLVAGCRESCACFSHTPVEGCDKFAVGSQNLRLELGASRRRDVQLVSIDHEFDPSWHAGYQCRQVTQGHRFFMRLP